MSHPSVGSSSMPPQRLGSNHINIDKYVNIDEDNDSGYNSGDYEYGNVEYDNSTNAQNNVLNDYNVVNGGVNDCYNIVYNNRNDRNDDSTYNPNDSHPIFQRLFGNTDFLAKCLNKSTYHPLNRRGDGDIGAGRPRRYISLANEDRASRMVCHIPAILTFTFTGWYIFGALFCTSITKFLFVSVAVYMFGYAIYMASGALRGVFQMRKAVETDWNQKCDIYLQENPSLVSGMLHFVILPNYDEHADMLSITLNNIANNSLAKDYIVVVLAMEAREGEAGKAKSKKLIEKHGHQFRGIFATFHPENIPNEIKGKSSNTQWAFRELQKYYGSYVSQNPDENHDVSKVFITVQDADSILHRDYFPCLTYQALQKTPDQRSWSMWQSPILMFRNFESACAALRNTAYGTFLYELSGLATAGYLDHLCFSCYSLTLAMANHPCVDGWDTDVIAEDHHMSIKCLSASYWERINSKTEIESRSLWNVEPIWVPTTCYLVEDPKGAWASTLMRFHQARRHMQGIAEFSYILLQHYSLAKQSITNLAIGVHLQYLYLALKYLSISVINALHTFCWVHVALVGIFHASKTVFLWASGVETFETIVANAAALKAASEESICMNVMIFLAMCSTPVCLSIVTANWLAAKDAAEGRYGPVYFNNVETRQVKRFENHEYQYFLPDHKGNVVAPLTKEEERVLGLRKEEDSITGKSVGTSTISTTASTPCKVVTKKEIGKSKYVSIATSNDEENTIEEVMTNIQFVKMTNSITLSSACIAKGEKTALIKTVSGIPGILANSFDINYKGKTGRLNKDTMNIPTAKGTVVRKLYRRKILKEYSWKLLLQVYFDLNLAGQPTLFFTGTIPMFLTVASLSKNGHKFDYVCAAKPPMESSSGVEGERIVEVV